MWRKILAALASVALWASLTATPAAAYSYDGSWYSNSAITDGVLTICFGGSTSDGLYTNRTYMFNEVQLWGQAIGIQFQNWTGYCTQSASNVQVIWGDCNNIAAIACVDDRYMLGGTVKQVWINYNYNTGYGSRYYGPTPVPTGGQDMPSVLLHEVGHALGLGHSSSNDGVLHVPDSGIGPDVMSNGGAVDSYCPNWWNGSRVIYIALDDAKGMQARYAGMPKGHTMLQNQAICTT